MKPADKDKPVQQPEREARNAKALPRAVVGCISRIDPHADSALKRRRRRRPDCQIPPVPGRIEDDLLGALHYGFIQDVYVRPRDNLIQSLVQLSNYWSRPSPIHRLHTQLSSLALISLDELSLVNGRLHAEGNKVHVVTPRVCKLRHPYVLKTHEHSLSGWPGLYHEIRQLCCMPPHPNVMPAPVALVTGPSSDSLPDPAGDIYHPVQRAPIVGFLLPFFPGKPLDHVIPYSNAASLTIKWLRQLASALLHVLRHGNGPNRPGYYSDLKPDNVRITSDKNVILLDFEHAANWRRFEAPEVKEWTAPARNRCYRAWDPVHRNDCSALWKTSKTNPCNRRAKAYEYCNPPYGNHYREFWMNVTQEEKEKAMVFSLGHVAVCVLGEDLNVPMMNAPVSGVTLVQLKVRKFAFRTMGARSPEKRPGMEEVLRRFEKWEEEIKLGELKDEEIKLAKLRDEARKRKESVAIEKAMTEELRDAVILDPDFPVIQVDPKVNINPAEDSVKTGPEATNTADAAGIKDTAQSSNASTAGTTADKTDLELKSIAVGGSTAKINGDQDVGQNADHVKVEPIKFVG